MSMRISELAQRSGLPTATIKYYLRERLLHRGTTTAPNQASYDERHLRRLRLIRVLLDIGRLSVSDVRAVVDALDNERVPVHDLIGIAQYALGPHPDAPADDETRAALDEIDAFIRQRSWRVHADAPSRRVLADALVALRRLGQDVGSDVFDRYADVASDLARWELDRTPLSGSRSGAVEGSIIGTVVFEAALVALRKLAHEDGSAKRTSRKRRATPRN